MSDSTDRLRDFHNRLRIMRSIDLYELSDSGVEVGEWENFRDNPYTWFIEASDEDAGRVWQIMERISA